MKKIFIKTKHLTLILFIGLTFWGCTNDRITIDKEWNKNGDIEIKITGIRPGEKIHEIMITNSDSAFTIDLNNYYAILPSKHKPISIYKKSRKVNLCSVCSKNNRFIFT